MGPRHLHSEPPRKYPDKYPYNLVAPLFVTPPFRCSGFILRTDNYLVGVHIVGNNVFARWGQPPNSAGGYIPPSHPQDRGRRPSGPAIARIHLIRSPGRRFGSAADGAVTNPAPTTEEQRVRGGNEDTGDWNRSRDRDGWKPFIVMADGSYYRINCQAYGD